MYKNIFDGTDFIEPNEGECFRLNANSGDVVRVKGLDNVSVMCYDEDNNLIGKIPVSEAFKEVKEHGIKESN